MKSIGDSAFEDCTSLKSITLSEGLEDIGNHVFYGCTLLTEIEIPASVEYINASVILHGADNIETVKLGEGRTSLNHYAFQDCDTVKCTLLA